MDAKDHLPGQVPDQGIPSLLGPAQLNGISLPPLSVPNFEDLQSDWRRDPGICPVRKSIRRRIAGIFSHHPNVCEWGQRVDDVVDSLEYKLLMEAASKEEYMNQEILNHRMHILISHTMSGTDYSQTVDRHFISSSFSSSISMTIPTPGMSHSSSSSNTADPPHLNSVTTGSGCCMLVTDNTNESAGFLLDGSFSASNGSLCNVYNQGFANTSFTSGGNNMLSPTGSSQVASQMISIPEWNILKSSTMNSFSSGCGFSNVGVVKELKQHSKQYYSGQMGSTSRRKSSMCPRQPFSYGFPNGAFNVGSSVEYIDEAAAASERYLNPSSCVNLSKSQQQHLDHQVQQKLMQGSNRDVNPLDFQYKAKENSAWLPHSSLWIPQQVPQIIPDVFDILPKMNYNAPNSTREHALQFQQSEAQPPCNPVEQACRGPNNEEALQPKISEQCQIFEFRSTHQQRMELEPSILMPLVQDECQWPQHLSENSVVDASGDKCQGSFTKTDWSLMHLSKCGKFCNLWSHYRNCHNDDCLICESIKRLRVSQPCDPGLEKLESGTRRSFNDADGPTRDTLEDMQSLKNRKMEHPSLPHFSENDTCQVQVPSFDQPCSPQEGLPQTDQQLDVPLSVKPDVMEGNLELFTGPIQDSANFNESRNEDSEDFNGVKPSGEPGISKDVITSTKEEDIQVETKCNEAKPELKHGIAAAAAANHVSGTESRKLKMKGVSLTELFTSEQIKVHIASLRQWVGQSKAKAARNYGMAHFMNENLCRLCAVEKLSFEPSPIYCSSCGAGIKRNNLYYSTLGGEKWCCFCTSCYNETRGVSITVDGLVISKAKLEKKKNDEKIEESWVQCDKCEGWQHQICALFNGKRNERGKAEYTCPNCHVQEIDNGERVPLPQSVFLGAKDLPRSMLSDHIEKRLFMRLNQEREQRANVMGKNFDEVPGAEDLVVRVVLSVDKRLQVKKRFLDNFRKENYPTEFPYKSKVIFLFQKIEGVEVCLFGMYVQEFGSECGYPNQRCVYLSYLDSVKYFRPETKTVTGEALRTFVYHEILIGYLDYCKKRGFSRCYIWACPPLKGEDYILYCHPDIQKTPKSDKLREWYLAMLRKAANESIVVDVTNLYDQFFVTHGEYKVTATQLPYFDGDYWPGAAEEVFSHLEQEEDGRKLKRNIKKSISRRALKATGYTNLSGNVAKDILLMQKLGDSIYPMKEDFIMVHLQYSCTNCCQVIVVGRRWFCNLCKKFQLCEKCYDAERNLDERNKHPINSKEKHVLSQVEVNNVSLDTEDEDENLDSEFLDSRQTFLSFCQGNHYQYDTLRRAKHSSMMILYHLHNPMVPAFMAMCSICRNDIEVGQGWHCEICPEFDVCGACHQREGGVNHIHKLARHSSVANLEGQSQDARKRNCSKVSKVLGLLLHASQCFTRHCSSLNCRKIKALFSHSKECKTRLYGGCIKCKKIWYILTLHSRNCKDFECRIPRCKDLKKHAERLQSQSDSRRRAAVGELVRRRAA